jgi:hypothetical protein
MLPLEGGGSAAALFGEGTFNFEPPFQLRESKGAESSTIGAILCAVELAFVGEGSLALPQFGPGMEVRIVQARNHPKA